MSDLKRLRELATAATPGDWRYIGQGDIEDENGRDIGCVYLRSDSGPDANGMFIAAANPQTVLALLDALEAEQRNAKRYRFLRDRRYRWHDRVFLDYWSAQPSGDELDAAIDAAEQEERT